MTTLVAASSLPTCKLTLYKLRLVLIFALLSGSIISRAARNNMPLPAAYTQRLKSVPASARFDSLEAWRNRTINTDTKAALQLSEYGMALAREHTNTPKEALFANLAGMTFIKLNQYDSAFRYLRHSLAIWKTLQDSANIASALNNLGVAKMDIGQYDTSLVYHLESLDFAERTGNAMLMASNLNNIGLLHYYLGNYQRSLVYYFRSAKVRTERMDSKGMALLYNNIGIDYYYLGKTDSVIYYFKKSLEIYRQTGDLRGQAMPLTNIGEMYLEKKQYNEALDYFRQAMAIEEQLHDTRGKANSLQMIGNVYSASTRYAEALQSQKQALQLLESIPSPVDIRDVSKAIAETYEKMGYSMQALSYFKRFMALSDSIFTLEKAKQLDELETRYQTVQKEKQIALQQADIEKKEIEIRHRGIFLTLALVSALLLSGLVLIVWKAYTDKKRTSNLLAEKNRNITESITYARKIQTAVLPPEELLRCLLPNHFVFFRPRDIVSGDFYWISKKDQCVYIAVADCTGHGVPGAFMSMLGFSMLNELVGLPVANNAANLLDTLRSKIKSALRQTGKDHEAQDGIDIALCIIDNEQHKLQYAGANNPLLILRQGQLLEFKADRMPIGIQAKEKPFTNHLIDTQHGDMVYLFSDGYIDQFGGVKNMRYRMENFRRFLISIHTLPPEQQKRELDTNLKQWMGATSQLDDILVLGFSL